MYELMNKKVLDSYNLRKLCFIGSSLETSGNTWLVLEDLFLDPPSTIDRSRKVCLLCVLGEN
jgi:hypothetical protein